MSNYYLGPLTSHRIGSTIHMMLLDSFPSVCPSIQSRISANILVGTADGFLATKVLFFNLVLFAELALVFERNYINPKRWRQNGLRFSRQVEVLRFTTERVGPKLEMMNVKIESHCMQF